MFEIQELPLEFNEKLWISVKDKMHPTNYVGASLILTGKHRLPDNAACSSVKT